MLNLVLTAQGHLSGRQCGITNRSSALTVERSSSIASCGIVNNARGILETSCLPLEWGKYYLLCRLVVEMAGI